MARHLLSKTTRWYILKGSSSSSSELASPLPSLYQAFKGYSKSNKDDDNHTIGEKARSTAEEFIRVAKEMTESLTSQRAKHTWEEAKETMSGENELNPKPESESELADEKYKDKV